MPHIGDGERRFADSTKTAQALLCSIYLDRARATCVAPVAMLSHKLLDCAVHADTDGAQPKQHYLLKQYRSCEVFTGCVAEERVERRFHKSPEHATMVQSGEFYNESDHDSFRGTCYPLEEVLAGAGINPGRTIHFMSVDTEGAELSIFKNFPFQLFDIRVVAVEVSRETSFAIDNLFLLNGFIKAANLGKDSIYVDRLHYAESLVANKGRVFFPTTGVNDLLPGTFGVNVPYPEFQLKFGVTGQLDRSYDVDAAHKPAQITVPNAYVNAANF